MSEKTPDVDTPNDGEARSLPPIPPRPTPAERMPFILLGPQLRDYDAAAACVCSCHPSNPSSLHDGGVSCSCQLTDEERAAKSEKLLGFLADLWKDGTSPFEKMRDEVASTGAQLGVETWLEVAGAPLVICGVVDGRFFYMRERHGTYRVVAADGEDLLTDVWGNYDAPSFVVADGTEDDFYVNGEFDIAHVVRLCVDAVRTGVRRQTCEHGYAPFGAWFCPDCGVRLDG